MADTIKTGTTRIKEGALVPEALRFESEPWTFFYMVGQTVRELQKALGNKASTRATATWLFLALGVALSSYLPVSAETRSTQLSLMQERPAPRMILLAAASSHLPLNMTTFVPARPLPERPARFTVLLSAAYNRERRPERLSSVEVVKTPFVRQARVTVVQFWGGRLQLGSFAKTHHMENVLLGFSRSGGLGGFRVSRQGHPGAWVPRADTSYGISLTFRLGRDAHTGRRVESWRCLAWIVGAGGGCRL